MAKIKNKIKSDKLKLPLRTIELFAGVGGFRIGLEGVEQEHSHEFSVVWSNQWEPSTKVQHASNVYVKKWGEKGHSNENISLVKASSIPTHDLLVGGFPCQDYSVARVLSHAAGLAGKKGVLWWEIYKIIKEKKDKPSFLMLENVDRLLKSPIKQRGRDFAVMLASLAELGYVVEWRIINAGEYGMPQRRRRIFIMGYKKSSGIAAKILKSEPTEWMLLSGVMAKAFPVRITGLPMADKVELKGELDEISENFHKGNLGKSPFHNAGIMINGIVHTLPVKSDFKGKLMTLGSVLLHEDKVDKEYYLNKDEIQKWEYLKNAKSEPRKGRDGFTYQYKEGGIPFPDPLEGPSRTIITGEGGPTPSRFKHVVRTPSGKLRRLTPIELERLNMFPDNHTAGMPDARRAFFMGNALVVGVIDRLGRSLINALKPDKSPAKSFHTTK